MKTRAKMELMKVMVMDMLMSPFKRRVQKFEPVPPGQQPSTNRPSLTRIIKWRKNNQFKYLKSLSSVMAQPMK